MVDVHAGAEVGSATFSEWVRSQSGSFWDGMVRHRFTLDVASDTLAADVWRRYLIYEHAFVETAVTIFGYALVKAPTIDEQTRLAAVITALTTEQVGYFEATFDRLGVTTDERRTVHAPLEVVAFREGMLALAAHGTYLQIIAGMAAAEWAYLTWCTAAKERRQLDPTMVDWVALHVAPPFVEQVAWLRGQLDLRGPDLAMGERAIVAEAFRHTLELEIGFHHAPYRGAASVDIPEREDR